MSPSIMPSPSTKPSSPVSLELMQRINTFDVNNVEPTNADYERANELMLEERLRNNRRPSSTFSLKDANPVLTRIAQGSIKDATPGLVQVLLDNGADVRMARRRSTNIFKRIMCKDQVDIPNNIIEQATRNCSDELVFLLAQHADEQGATEALHIAIGRDEPIKAYILLARGADASRACEQFLQAVDSGSNDMVNVLLRKVKGACPDCRNKGLVRAAQHGHGAKARMLIDNSADVTFESGAALLAACRNRKEDAAIEIASHVEMSRHPMLLDKAVAEAYDYKLYDLIEVCLNAGAKGPMTDTTLLKAVERQQMPLVESFVQHGASVSQENGAAIRLAVKSGRPDLLQLVLRGKPSKIILDAAITQSVGFPDLSIVYQMVNLLLSAGLRGDSVSGTLLGVLDRTLVPGDEDIQRNLIDLLLGKGQADVNFNGGRSLVTAISKRRVDTLLLLLQYRPTVDSLSTAAASAMSLDVPELRLQIVEIIMQARSGHPTADVAGDNRLERAAATAAAKGLLLDILQYLAKSLSSPTSFVAAFVAVSSDGEKWLSPSGLEVTQFLLEHGVSGPEVDNAFCRAAQRYNRDAIELLYNFTSPNALGTSLSRVMTHSKDWQSPDNLWLIEFLLEYGCSGEPVNVALLHAASTYAIGGDVEALIETLLTVGNGADVNFRDGEALKIAIRFGNAPLLERLVSSGARAEAITQAFATAVTTPLEEEKALALIDVLARYSSTPGTGCDFKTTLRDGRPPIAACVATHRKSSKLVNRLLQLGCGLEDQFSAKIDDYKHVGEEKVTILLWALCPHGDAIVTSDVINALIDAKANVKFTSRASRTTPLILAAKHGRSDVVSKLIAEKADVRTRDCFERAALFYASQAGDLKAVKDLIKANSRVNDGSLQEAARNLHSKVVAALIKGGHDPNFPSSKPEHDGRSALQELTAMCDGTRDAILLEETIMALGKDKASSLTKHRDSGKNALFFALGNAEPISVTRALLDVFMWRYINDEQNDFVYPDAQTGNEFHYSPTMYLKKMCQDNYHDGAHDEKLLKLLYDKQCLDRFYIQFGPGNLGARQPFDAVGMPDKIVEDEARRRKEDEKRHIKRLEHEMKLQHEQEEAHLKAQIDTQRHQQKLNQAAATHHNHLMQNGQVTEQQIEAQQQKLAVTAAGLQQAEEAKLRTAQISAAKIQFEQKQKLQFQQQQAEQTLSLQQEKDRLARRAESDKLAAQKKIAAQKLASEKRVGSEKLSQQQEKERLSRKAAADKLAAVKKKLELQRRY